MSIDPFASISRRRLLTGVAILTLAAAAAPRFSWAARGPVAAKLNAQQSAELQRVEAYLNGIRTMRSRFLQVAENGAQAEGDIYLSRPGLMRIEYDPPVPHLIVATGRLLVYHEKRLNQTSYIPLSSTLAGFLVRDPINLSGDITVTAFEQQKGAVRASLVQTSEPEAGQITLVFSDDPLQLRQWSVIDGQGSMTRISLLDPQFGIPLDKTLFEFQEPERERFDR